MMEIQVTWEDNLTPVWHGFLDVFCTSLAILNPMKRLIQMTSILKLKEAAFRLTLEHVRKNVFYS